MAESSHGAKRDFRLKATTRSRRNRRQDYRGFCRFLCLLAGLALPVLFMPGHAADREYLAPLHVPGARTVGVDEARWLYDDGVLFIDVRNPRLFARRHIPGAVHLDFANRFTLAALGAVAHRDQPIVIYSSGARCARAYRASMLAVDWGFSRVHYFRGGIVDWRDVLFPLQSLR